MGVLLDLLTGEREVEDLDPFEIAFRFQRTGKVLPASWTYPETGEYEGAQVWTYSSYGSGRGRGGDFGCTLQRGGDHPQWNDGFNYGPTKYPQIMGLVVDGFSGESGPLDWKAVTEGDVQRAYLCPHRDLRQRLDSWVQDHAGDLNWNGDVLPPNRSFCRVDEWVDFHPSRVILRQIVDIGEPIDPTFERTISDGLVNS